MLRITQPANVSKAVWSVAILMICLMSSGCMFSRSNIADAFSTTLGTKSEQSSGTTEGSAAPQSEFIVRMDSSLGKPKIYKGLLDKPKTVQDALVESKALKRFRDMEITIHRKVSDRPLPFKMQVDFEPQEKAVSLGQDYALHPGDRIAIKAKEDFIGRMLNKAFSR